MSILGSCDGGHGRGHRANCGLGLHDRTHRAGRRSDHGHDGSDDLFHIVRGRVRVVRGRGGNPYILLEWTGGAFR